MITLVKPSPLPAAAVNLQIEYTTRNSLPVGAELRAGAEVLDDRTIRFKGKDILDVWTLYRSR